MKLKLYNTLTRKVDEFIPLQNDKVGLYTCGPTVYSYVHVGNMRAYLFADTLRRTLEFAGYNVDHVMNITDVGHLTDDGDSGEDKLEVGAKKEGLNAWQLAEKYTEFFFGECGLLNILTAKTICKATDYIAEQIELIKSLEAKGFTYQTSDGIYFWSEKFNRYGDLAKLDIAGLEAGKRVDLGEKKSITDFALWKFSPKDQKRAMEWESPWGVGFPGWHIECSAMSMHFLGEQFDLHTGGVDHIPVHHTNEIAQSECASGTSPFVRYWLHCEFLILDDGSQKMSKSLGNIVTISDLKQQGVDPLAFRYLCLTTHYRKQLQFSQLALNGAQTAYERLRLVCNEYLNNNSSNLSSKDLSQLASKFEQSMKDAIANDLNTSQVLANLWVLLENKGLSPNEKAYLIKLHDRLLGLKCSEVYVKPQLQMPQAALDLLEQRNKLRLAKDWAGADQARDKLKSMGYEVCDDPKGAYLVRSKS